MHTSEDIPALPPGAEVVVFYDGVCGLCNWLVGFLARRDRRAVLCFAPLQGATAGRMLPSLGIEPNDLDTLVVVEVAGVSKGEPSIRSDGVLAALARIGGIWKPAGWLRVIPRSWRDAVYRWIARSRYKWFGKTEACPLPSPEWRDRFLE